MNTSGEERGQDELVLIRRRAPVEEAGHKGGVWKIAYADFMTAMMTFFLVMWLINAADKRTVTQVASYFNPVRLVDKSPTKKGLHDPGSGMSEAGEQKQAPHEKEKEKPAAAGKGEAGKGEAGKAKFSEEALLQDPVGVLSKLAAEAQGLGLPSVSEGEGRLPFHSGPIVRNPFEPEAKPDRVPDRSAIADNAAQQGESKPDPQADANQLDHKDDPSVQAEPASKSPGTRSGKGKAEREAASQAAQRKAEMTEEANRIEAEIAKVIRSALPGTIPNVEVRVTDEGVLISLSDDAKFGMFAVGSAEPRPATVVMMENVGRILSKRSERIVIRGHTDGRPYRSAAYDNWRLSAARAHITYFMLVRGGLDEKRFEKIEGYADRDLRVPGNPDAAQNRRIEILLRKAGA